MPDRLTIHPKLRRFGLPRSRLFGHQQVEHMEPLTLLGVSLLAHPLAQVFSRFGDRGKLAVYLLLPGLVPWALVCHKLAELL